MFKFRALAFILLGAVHLVSGDQQSKPGGEIQATRNESSTHVKLSNSSSVEAATSQNQLLHRSATLMTNSSLATINQKAQNQSAQSPSDSNSVATNKIPRQTAKSLSSSNHTYKVQYNKNESRNLQGHASAKNRSSHIKSEARKIQDNLMSADGSHDTQEYVISSMPQQVEMPSVMSGGAATSGAEGSHQRARAKVSDSRHSVDDQQQQQQQQQVSNAPSPVGLVGDTTSWKVRRPQEMYPSQQQYEQEPSLAPLGVDSWTSSASGRGHVFDRPTGYSYETRTGNQYMHLPSLAFPVPTSSTSSSARQRQLASVEVANGAATSQVMKPGSPARICRPTAGGALGHAQVQLTDVGPRLERLAVGLRLRSQLVFRVLRADSLADCESACSRSWAPDGCRSFNFRSQFAAENCELSRFEPQTGTRLEEGAQFERDVQSNFYSLVEDPAANQLGASNGNDCIEVSHSCSPDGMEFSLQAYEPFSGQIYTYGFHDTCFVDAQSSTNSVLRISRAGGFPRCGTQQVGDIMSNIVVVQFSDQVQTTRDRRYNITCSFAGPAETVVTSSYLDAHLDERTPMSKIEQLPVQNVVTSNVHLKVLYRGQPTNNIAIGDMLTFRLETRGSQARAESGIRNEIFATNVIAKDPYSGRQVQLIDARGCPVVSVDVFPELQRMPDGALESEFYAFKIPDANFLIFQATVRTCKAPCEPVICTNGPHHTGAGSATGVKGSNAALQAAPSWGRRRRRSTIDTDEIFGESVEHVIPARLGPTVESDKRLPLSEPITLRRPELGDAEEEVKELFRVYMSRDEIDKPLSSKLATAQKAPLMASIMDSPRMQVNKDGDDQRKANEEELDFDRYQVCVAQVGYQMMLSIIVALSVLLLAILVATLYATRRAKFHVRQPFTDAIF